MTKYPEAAARFASDTATHQMIVLHEHGLYRHLRVTPQQHGFYWFDLITVPYGLIFRGDGESYVFAIDATEDMFNLFRKSSYKRSINPGYWSEKLRSSRDAATSYSEKLFEAEVARDLAVAEEDYPGITAAWAEHLEDEFNIEYEEEARRALDEFRFGERHRASCSECDWQFQDESYTATSLELHRHRKDAGEEHTGTIRDLTFTFSDTWEWQLQDFNWWFLWACHAILAGIARYDRLRYYGLEKLATPKAVAA